MNQKPESNVRFLGITMELNGEMSTEELLIYRQQSQLKGIDLRLEGKRTIPGPWLFEADVSIEGNYHRSWSFTVGVADTPEDAVRETTTWALDHCRQYAPQIDESALAYIRSLSL